MDFARFPVMRDIFYRTAIFSRVSLVSTHHKLHLRNTDQSPGGGEAEEGAHPGHPSSWGPAAALRAGRKGGWERKLWHRRRDYSKNERSVKAALTTEGTSNYRKGGMITNVQNKEARVEGPRLPRKRQGTTGILQDLRELGICWTSQSKKYLFYWQVN